MTAHYRLMFALFVFVLMPVVGSAEVLQWSSPQPTLTFTAAQGKFRAWLENPMVTVNYTVNATEVDSNGNAIRTLACDSQVPLGTRVRFSFANHVPEDIYWFGSGKAQDCPYGDWSAGEPPKEQRCAPKNLYASRVHARNLVDLYGTLAITPPQKSVAVSGGTCTAEGDNKVCVLNTPGTVRASFSIAQTTGKFWGGFWEYKYPSPSPLCYGRTGMRGAGDAAMTTTDRSPFTLTVPQQTATCSITVSDETPTDETIPRQPVVSASGASCIAGAPYAITMSATSPDNHSLRYLIDWDANGVPDQFVPPSGYVSSGTSQSASRTFATSGAKSIRVAAQDDQGLMSGWSVYTFSCAGSNDTAEGFWWDVGAWHACVQGTSTRIIRCRNDVGAVVADSNCPAPKPAVTANCNAGETGPIGIVDLPIRVKPSLVRAGDTARVYWGPVLGMHACTVRADVNGDSWPLSADDLGLESSVGGERTSPITDETTYVLRCTDDAGTVYTNKASVRILPSWQEF